LADDLAVAALAPVRPPEMPDGIVELLSRQFQLSPGVKEAYFQDAALRDAGGIAAMIEGIGAGIVELGPQILDGGFPPVELRCLLRASSSRMAI
jgi:hypothetical protein